MSSVSAADSRRNRPYNNSSPPPPADKKSSIHRTLSLFNLLNSTHLLLLTVFLLNSISPLVLADSTTSVFNESASPLNMVYADGTQRVLRVMTFNIWLSGKRVKNGLKKISDQIKAVDPDIVTIQELQTVEVGKNLTDLLGASKWQLIHHPNATYPDTAIITKHKFVSEPMGIQFQRNISDFLFNEDHFPNDSIVTYGLGASVELDDRRRINVFSLHLDWKSYGPYAANNKQVNSKKQIMIGERNKEGYGRAQNIEQLIASEAFKKYMGLSDEQLFIVAGDFNSPSHLDWSEERKETHGGWTFEWPSTKLLTDEGFVDTYRHINPNVVKSPGETWSTVQKSVGPEWDWTIPEPQDRIDFIFYKPNSFSRPIRAETFAGQGQLSPIPDQWENEWPSDHYAVITDFAMDGVGDVTAQIRDAKDKIVLNGDGLESL